MLFNFITPDTDLSHAISGTYNYFLVVCSIVIAIIASYAALGMVKRRHVKESQLQKNIWLWSGAIMMGLGVSVMHFVGMLALSLPIRISYNIFITLVSILPAILASFIALKLFDKKQVSLLCLTLAGILMGAGIGSMHYIGMFAMQAQATMLYDPLIFSISIIVAVVLAICALIFVGHVAKQKEFGIFQVQMGGAIIFGLAISGMHYTAMQATYFFPNLTLQLKTNGIDVGFLATIIIGFITLIISIALLLPWLDRYKTDLDRLKKSQQQVNLLLDSAAEGIFGIDKQGICQFCNITCTQLFGYQSTTQLVGLAIEIFIQQSNIGGENRQSITSLIRETLETGNPLSSQNAFFNSFKGKTIYIEFNCHPVIEGNIITGAIITFLDISKRFKIQQALKQSEEMFRNLIAQSPLSTIIVAADGNISEINHAAKKMWGINIENKTDYNFLKDARFKMNGTLPYLEKTLGGVAIEVPDILYEPMGDKTQSRWIAGYFYPVKNENNQVTKIVLIHWDSSLEREQKEQILQAKNEAEQANLAKSLFLSNMSHELRTPLNAILGFSQLLQMELTDEKHQEQVGYIIKSGEHLLNLINEILNLSKIETGHIELSMEAVLLCDIVNECKKLLGIQAKERNIAITIDNEFNTGDCIVYADHTRMQQVVLNLLSNAIKYNKEKGDIKISYHKSHSEKLILSITDTGLGISPQNLKEMFKPFNRLGAESTTIEGTGIGLVITKKLIELMGGKISVHSIEGEGTTFSIEIPLTELSDEQMKTFCASQKKVTNVVDENKEADNNQLKLLYIEDNPTNLKLVKMLLEKSRPDLELIFAPSSQLGLDLAFSHQPNLILLDINLPGLDGYQVLKQLRKHPLTKNIAIIAITSNATKSDIEKGLNAGFNAYITKPLDIPLFHKIINQYI
jgi:PAS domain S-box-containing protein